MKFDLAHIKSLTFKVRKINYSCNNNKLRTVQTDNYFLRMTWTQAASGCTQSGFYMGWGTRKPRNNLSGRGMTCIVITHINITPEVSVALCIQGHTERICAQCFDAHKTQIYWSFRVAFKEGMYDRALEFSGNIEKINFRKQQRKWKENLLFLYIAICSFCSAWIWPQLENCIQFWAPHFREDKN